MFDELCRLCSQPHYNNETTEIFSENSGVTVAMMIRECTKLLIQENDELPFKICKECYKMLDNCYTFCKQCEYVDYKFRQGLIHSVHTSSVKKEVNDASESMVCVSQNNELEADTDIPDLIKKEEMTFDEDFSATQYIESSFYPAEYSPLIDTQSKTNFSTSNKVKRKKVKESKKNKTEEINKKEKQVAENVENSKNEIHMCYLCGALVKRIHSHMKSHRDAGKPKLKKFRCEKCGAAFSRLNNLNIHLKTHLDVKPLKCTLCDKRFIIKRYLDRHMIVHTGDRPWKCHFCSKAFQTKYNLNTHVRVHTREKPFECPFCDLCFRQRAALNLHVRTHNNSTAAICI